MKTVVGVSASIKFETHEVYPSSFINTAYTDSIIRANGIPFILPVCNNESILKKMVESVDGILLSGGEDIHPFLFNEEPIEKIGHISEERDFLDFKILKYAVEMKKPVLGICRGHQVINVFFSGNIYQDIATQTSSKIKHSQSARINLATHKINIKKDSFLYDIFGKSTEINSFHHQAIKDVSDKFDVIATSNDGIIEAIEYKGDEFIIGTQWHPEVMAESNGKMQEIFNRFVKKCKK